MHYFLSNVSSDNIIYSIDKVCVMGEIQYCYIERFSHDLSWFLVGEYNNLSNEITFPWLPKYLKDYKSYSKYGVGEYRNNFNITLSDNSSFYFGYKHNSNKIGSCSWKLELNPNKCLPCDFFDRFYKFVVIRSKSNSLRISQFDLALDFNLPRKYFYLEKDKRIYSTVNDGCDNITEYLSRHNSNGFCKLYNKSAESSLDYDLTRFEITLQDFSYSNLCSVFPKLHYCDYSQIKFTDSLPQLSQNDEIFVDLLRLHPDKLQFLTYRMRKKFEPYLCYQAPCYKPDYECYNKLVTELAVYFI